MGFNYAREKRHFDAEWRKLAAEYSLAGFGEAGIQAMRDFDWELFCKRRTYENSVQPFPSETIDGSDSENNSTLFQKFAALTDSFDESAFEGRYDWIETVTDPILSGKLSRLSNGDKELLTLLVFDGYTQTEIAAIQGCTKQAVSKRFTRIKVFLQ